MKRLWLGAIVSFVGTLACLGLWVFVLYLSLPSPQELHGCLTTKMHKVDLCPKSSRYLKFEEVNPVFFDALIVSEDSTFWHHNGLDWFEIKESFKDNLEDLKISRGASTITQQLAKNVFFTGEKTLSRKIKEAFLAVKIEKIFSKKEILEKYINIVEFGPNLYGLSAASHHYFSKHPIHLTPLESAFLVFLLPNPKGYYQSFEEGKLTDFAQRMVLLICNRLHFYKKIDEYARSVCELRLGEFPWPLISPSDFESFSMNLNDEPTLEPSDSPVYEENGEHE